MRPYRRIMLPMICLALSVCSTEPQRADTNASLQADPLPDGALLRITAANAVAHGFTSDGKAIISTQWSEVTKAATLQFWDSSTGKLLHHKVYDTGNSS